MAKDRKKLQHIHSSIPDKQPTAASLEVAEIAVNSAADKEFLSIKNTNDKVVRFSSDGQIIEWIERKEVMPYVGYVRGAAGPSATSGDTPTADGYGSYGIENTDLLNNKSELVFKLNQVAADLTTKHDKVNGKKDMYNKDVNPTTDGGINDGAGFFIDMSRYAMQDANPQFSSTTNTCRTTLSGTTIIRGLDGDCGSLLDIKVNSATTEVKTATTKVTSAHTTVGTATTIVNGDTSLFVSGTTQETKKGDVTETNLANKVENTSGTSTSNIVVDNIVNVSGETHITTTGNTAIHTENRLGLTARGLILESSESSIDITANNDICETAGNRASFYGVAQTNLGLDCADSTPSVVTNLYGDTINTDADTANTTIGTAITQINSANTNIGTATTVVGTADTKITSAKTVINTANTSATTATLSGNTLDIKEATRISAVTPSTTVNGTNLDINECGRISGKTNAFTIVECANGSGVANIQETTIELSGTTTSISGLTTINLSGNTINKNSLTSNTKTSSAYTSANTATTVINTANTSATTATLSGNTLQIRESGYIDYSGNTLTSYTVNKTCIQANTDLNMGGNSNTKIGYNCASDSGYSNNVLISASASANTYAPNVVISGTNLDIKETNTTINSCGKIEFTTDNFTVNSCSNSGTSTFNFCNGYTLNSDKVTIEECNGNGTILIKEKGINLSGGTLSSTTTADTIVKVGGNLSAFTTGNTSVITSGSTSIITEDSTTIKTTKGDTNINTTGNTNITSTSGVCVVADKTAAFVGTVKTNIGKNCSDGGQTDELNLNGDTINETGSTVNISGSSEVNISGGSIDISASTDVNISAGQKICESAATEADFYGPTTKIGISCGDSIATTTTIKGGELGISGNNVDISGATSIDISGGTIHSTSTGETCIVADTTAAFVGTNKTNIGKNCSDGGQTDVLNINGDTINITGGTISAYTTGNTCVVANNDLNLGGNANTNIGYDCGGSGIANNTNIYASTAVTINAPTTNITGDTNISGDTTINKNLTIKKDLTVEGDTYISGETTINKELTLITGLKKPLNWVYDDVCNHASGTTKFAESSSDESRTITIPSSAAHIKRETLSWTYGSVTNAQNGDYDPGRNESNNCTQNSDDSKFIIPKTISDITDGVVTLENGCLNVGTSLCVSETIAANGAIYSSDRNLKENINDIERAVFKRIKKVPLHSFNFKDDDTKRKTYGIIAQEVQEAGLNELVYVKEDGTLAVDYTSMLILRAAYLEDYCKYLNGKIAELENKIDEMQKKD